MERPPGRFTGGYTQFSYDITSLVKAGENLLGVEVSKPQEIVPSGELTTICEVCSGTVYFRFDWSTTNSAVKRFDTEIK